MEVLLILALISRLDISHHLFSVDHGSGFSILGFSIVGIGAIFRIVYFVNLVFLFGLGVLDYNVRHRSV